MRFEVTTAKSASRIALSAAVTFSRTTCNEFTLVASVYFWNAPERPRNSAIISAGASVPRLMRRRGLIRSSTWFSDSLLIPRARRAINDATLVLIRLILVSAFNNAATFIFSGFQPAVHRGTVRPGFDPAASLFLVANRSSTRFGIEQAGERAYLDGIATKTIVSPIIYL